MNRIPFEYIQQFSDALVEVDERAKRTLRNALTTVKLDDPAKAREDIAAIMERVVGASDILASTMTAEFYNGIREYQIAERLEATTDSGRDPDSTKNATYGITSRLEKEDAPSISVVEALLVQRVGYEIQRSVGRTMYRNGDIDPRKPKFARVPLGGDSCEFCRMLASRGFEYNSELTAGKLNPDHYHDGCRCRVVCSWEKDPIIGGMEEDEYNLRAWDEYKRDAWSFASRDHSQHQQHQKEKRRNRYTDDGKLKAGYSGLRIDQQADYTEYDRKKTAVRAAAKRGDAQRGQTRKKQTETEIRRASFKPVNEQTYSFEKNRIERLGGTVLRGGEDVERHLDFVGADASCVGGIVMFRSSPTVSEVLEESFHFDQERRGDYSDKPAYQMFLLREIDAQRHLLKMTSRHKIPEAEVEMTRKNLAYYEEELLKFERGEQ